jgi:integrase
MGGHLLRRQGLIPKRSIVKQRIGKVKTEASKKSIPLDDVLIEELLGWRQETPYAQDSDYVFASTKMRGKQPYWMSRISSITSSQLPRKVGSKLRDGTHSATIPTSGLSRVGGECAPPPT